MVEPPPIVQSAILGVLTAAAILGAMGLVWGAVELIAALSR